LSHLIGQRLHKEPAANPSRSAPRHRERAGHAAEPGNPEHQQWRPRGKLKIESWKLKRHHLSAFSFLLSAFPVPSRKQRAAPSSTRTKPCLYRGLYERRRAL